VIRTADREDQAIARSDRVPAIAVSSRALRVRRHRRIVTQALLDERWKQGGIGGDATLLLGIRRSGATVPTRSRVVW
jgi:hypothetical protein